MAVRKRTRRAAVAQQQVCGCGRGTAVATGHPDGPCAAIVIDRQAELPETFDHHPGVVAFQGPGEQRFAPGQRGANQCAVGDALGTRRADRGPQWPGRLDLDGIDHSPIIPLLKQWTTCYGYNGRSSSIRCRALHHERHHFL